MYKEQKASKGHIIARRISEQELCSILIGCVSLQRRTMNIIHLNDHKNISVVRNIDNWQSEHREQSR